MVSPLTLVTGALSALPFNPWDGLIIVLMKSGW